MNDLGTDESGRMNTVSIHTTLVPYIAAAGELKTKPTQHSVRDLNSLGIQPDLLLCRVDRPRPDGERAKMAQFCNVRKDAVIPDLDATRIYAVPLPYQQEGINQKRVAKDKTDVI